MTAQEILNNIKKYMHAFGICIEDDNLPSDEFIRISDVIKDLVQVKKEHGNIPVQIQDEPKDPNELITSHQGFFIIPEKYEDGWFCNIRWWPY